MKRRKGKSFLEVLGVLFLYLLVFGVLVGMLYLGDYMYTEAQRTRNADRVITLYGANGALRQWTGKFDVEYDRYAERVSFLSGDKTIVIRGGAVVNEER